MRRTGRSLVDPDAVGGVTLAEVVRPDGTVVRSSPRNLPLLIPARDLARIAGRAAAARLGLACPARW